MRKVVFSLLGLLFFTHGLWALPKKKKPRISKPSVQLVYCPFPAHSEAEYTRVFRDRKALEKQNFVVDFWKLERVEDDADLQMLVMADRLVPMPIASSTYYIDPALTKRTYFARLFTVQFIHQFTSDFYAATQSDKMKFVFNPKTKKNVKVGRGKVKRTKITGLVRTRAHQAALVKRLPKGQAASDKNGPACQSSHLAGTTFDFSIKGFTREEKCWTLEYLYQLQMVEHIISVIWEPKSNAMHVMVFPFITFTDEIH